MQCENLTPSYQGLDMIQCQNESGHGGHHEVNGIFPFFWNNCETCGDEEKIYDVCKPGCLICWRTCTDCNRLNDE